MSSNVPAHKQTDPNMKPGQQVNPLGFVIQPSEKTLDEYIRRKQQHEALDSVAKEKKLTFDQWYDQYYPYSERPSWPFDVYRKFAQAAWKAAQEDQ